MVFAKNGNGDRARSRLGRGGPRSGERSYDLKPTFFLNLKPTLFIVGNQFAPGTEHFLGGAGGGPRSGERSYGLKPTSFLNLKPTSFMKTF